jgi:hypothetical protein
MKNFMSCRTVSVNRTAVYHAAVPVSHATVIIREADAFVSCDVSFVTGVAPVFGCASRTDMAAGTIFCRSAQSFRCNDPLVRLPDIFVNETRRFFMLRSASVNATGVYFSGGGTIESLNDTVLYGRSVVGNATSVYFSVRSARSSTTGVYFRGGSIACSISGVFNNGGSVPVNVARVYFSMKHISDNGTDAFDKGKRETGKAARVYFTMKSTFGSDSGTAGRVIGNINCKSGGHVPATAGNVMQESSSGRQSAPISRRDVVISCNTDAFVPDVDTPGKRRKMQIQLSFTSATAHYTFSGSYSAVVLNDSDKNYSPIPKT